MYQFKGLEITGAVINIIFSLFSGFSSLFFAVVACVNILFDQYDSTDIGMFILWSLIFIFCIGSFFSNILFFLNPRKYKRYAVIFGFLNFSLLGSILLIVNGFNPTRRLPRTDLATANRISAYKKMLDEGAISFDEYNALRSHILNPKK